MSKPVTAYMLYRSGRVLIGYKTAADRASIEDAAAKLNTCILEGSEPFKAVEVRIEVVEGS